MTTNPIIDPATGEVIDRTAESIAEEWGFLMRMLHECQDEIDRLLDQRRNTKDRAEYLAGLLVESRPVGTVIGPAVIVTGKRRRETLNRAMIEHHAEQLEDLGLVTIEDPPPPAKIIRPATLTAFRQHEIELAQAGIPLVTLTNPAHVDPPTVAMVDGTHP